MPLNGSPLPNSVYISLDSRPKPNEYHWGLVFIDAKGGCVLYHALNRDGPWRFQERQGDPGDNSLTLITLVYVGPVNLRGAIDVVRSVPADGKPSLRNREAFTCRTWVKDVLVALNLSGNIVLPSSVDSLEAKAKDMGARFFRVSEVGGGATVVNPLDF
ncbi:hypothetical protein GGS20DRAFT_554650 [Poronia punctata]|nr:hypothetical protein GGS20DRAFT_554650 [Poronia punctata]